MSLRRVAARGAHIAWKCAATPSARTWRPLETAELACASRELARCRRGPRNFASSPIEDSDIFGVGGSQGIDTYTSKGFVIGGVEYQGNVFLYQELSLLWGVKTVEEITPDALVAAHIVDPAPDILIVGCGNKIQALPAETLEFFRNTETMLEVLDTPNAIATYNILVQEGRQVAAALLLPSA